MSVDSSDSAFRRTWYRRVIHTSVLELGNVDLDCVRYRPAMYPQFDTALLPWFLALRACQRRTVPVTLALLEEKSAQLAVEPGVNGYKSLTDCMCREVKRNDVISIFLVGTGA